MDNPGNIQYHNNKRDTDGVQISDKTDRVGPVQTFRIKIHIIASPIVSLPLGRLKRDDYNCTVFNPRERNSRIPRNTNLW